MKRETNIYEPIMSDCQMIFSKRLNRMDSKELTLNGQKSNRILKSSDLKESYLQKYDDKSDMKRTKMSVGNK